MSAPDWPTVGSTFVDDTGRTLEVRAVDPTSKQERHVVGVLKLGGRDVEYACDLRTFEVVWRAREVKAEELRAEVPPLVEDPQPATPLYDSRGKALTYTRRS